MAFCINCGTTLEADRAFCTQCGQPAEMSDPAAPPPAAELEPATVRTVTPRPPGPPPNTSAAALAAVGLAVAIAAAVVGLVVAVSSWAPTPVHAVATVTTPTPSASGPTQPILTVAGQQADRLSQFLARSAAARVTITPAIDDTARCRGLTSTAAVFRAAVHTRLRLAHALPTVDWQSLPGGATLRTQLDAAFTASAAADRDYQKWAIALTKTHCHPARTKSLPTYAQALRDDRTATRAKKQFVAAWNPIARTYGLLPQIWFDM
jgi:hypothetical protein